MRIAFVKGANYIMIGDTRVYAPDGYVPASRYDYDEEDNEIHAVYWHKLSGRQFVQHCNDMKDNHDV